MQLNNKQENIDFILDLRGISCPLNFVKTKIKLDSMNTGEIIEILIDDGEAIESVPKSIEEEGHKIISIEKVEEFFKVMIGKL